VVALDANPEHHATVGRRDIDDGLARLDLDKQAVRSICGAAMTIAALTVGRT
jgi:hypothetical protein